MAFGGLSDWFKSNAGKAFDQVNMFDDGKSFKTRKTDVMKKREETNRKIAQLEKQAYQRAAPNQKSTVLARIANNNKVNQVDKRSNFESFLDSAATNIIYNNPLSIYAYKNWYDQGREVLGTALNNEQLRQSGTNALQGRRNLEAFNYDQAGNKAFNVAGNAVSGVLNAATNPYGRIMANSVTRTGLAGARYGLGSSSDTMHAIRESGGSRNAQLIGGGLTGLTSTALGSFGMGKLTQPSKLGIRGVMQAGLGEGAEELVEYGVDDAVARATYDPNRTIGQSLQNAGTAFGMGAFAGGVLGAGNMRYNQKDGGKQQFQQDKSRTIKIAKDNMHIPTMEAKVDQKLDEIDYNNQALNRTRNLGTPQAKATSKKLAQRNIELGKELKVLQKKLDIAKKGGLSIAGQNATDFERQKRLGRVFEGVDGKPRFEIDDSGAKLKIKESTATTLENALDHSELFKNYPELKNTLVQLDINPNNPAKSTGSFVPAENRSAQGLKNTEPEIVVKARNAKDAQATLLHELQHNIQETEGFAKGGNLGTVAGFSPEEAAQINQVRSLVEQVKDSATPLFDINRSNAPQSVKDWAMNLIRGGDEAIADFNKNTPFEQYRNLAGEAEARAVASRMNMSDAERYKMPDGTSVYHGSKNKIDRFDTPRSYSLESQGTGNAMGRGIYVTENQNFANRFGENKTEIKLPKGTKVFDIADYDRQLTAQEASAINNALKKDAKNWVDKKPLVEPNFKAGDNATESYQDLLQEYNQGTSDIMKDAGFQAVKYKEVHTSDMVKRMNGEKVEDNVSYVLFDEKLANNNIAKPQSTFYDSLDVPKEDLIIRDGGGKAMSVEPQTPQTPKRSQLSSKALGVPTLKSNDSTGKQQPALRIRQESQNQTQGNPQTSTPTEAVDTQVQDSLASSFEGDYTNQDAERQFEWGAPARNPRSKATVKAVADIINDTDITKAAAKAEQNGQEINYYAKKDKNGRGVGIEKFNPNKHRIEAGFVVDNTTGAILGNHIKVDETGISVNVSGQEVNVSNIIGNPQDWDGNYKMMETMDRNLKNNAPSEQVYRRTRRFLIDHKTKQEAQFREELSTVRSDLKSRAKDVMASKPLTTGSKQYKEDIFDYIEGNLTDAKLKSKYDAEAVAKIQQYKKDTRKLYDSLLDRVNETFARFGEQQVPKRKDYLTHISELNNKSWYAGELFGRLQNSFLGDGQTTTRGGVPSNIAGRTENFGPRKKWNRFFQPRQGNETIKDPFANVDTYVEPTLYNIYMTEAGVRARAIESAFRTASEMQQTDFKGVTDGLNETIKQFRGGDNAKLLTGIQEYANALAGKTQRWDRQVIDSSQASATALKRWQQLQRIGGRATILANASSVVSQSLNQPLAIARAGVKNYTTGMIKGLAGKTPIDQSAFIKARKTDVSSPFRSNFDKSMDVLGIPLQTVELAFVKNTWNAMYQKAVNDGYRGKEAVLEADRLTEQTVAGRGIADKPEAYRSTVANGLLQYTLEVSATNKSFFQDLSSTQKAEFIAATFVMNNLVGALTGFEPLPDYLEAALDGIASFFDDDDERSAAEKAIGTGQRFAGETFSMNPLLSAVANIALNQDQRRSIFGEDTDLGRFEGTAAPIKVLKDAYRGADSLRRGLTAEDEQERNGQLLDSRNSFLRSFVPAGNQARKTLTGLEANVRGYQINRTGDKMFDTPDSIAGKTQTAVFGPYSTKEARNYFDDKSKESTPTVPTIKIGSQTKKENGKFSERDKYDSVIHAYEGGKFDKNIDKYDTEELRSAIKGVNKELQAELNSAGITGIDNVKFDSIMAQKYAKHVKSFSDKNALEQKDAKTKLYRDVIKSQFAEIEHDLYSLSEARLESALEEGLINEQNIINALEMEKILYDNGLISKETLARKLDLDARGYESGKGGGRSGSKSNQLRNISIGNNTPQAGLFKVSAPPSVSLPKVGIKSIPRAIRIKRG